MFLIGSQGTGKKSFMHRFETGEAPNSKPIFNKQQFRGKTITLMMGKQQRIRLYNIPEAVIPAKATISHGFIYLVDLTSSDSLSEIKDLYTRLSPGFPENTFSCIIGTKVDSENVVVTREDLENLQDTISDNKEILQVSSLTGDGFEAFFDFLKTYVEYWLIN